MVTRALTRKAVRDIMLMRGQLIAIILLVAAGSATFIMMRSMHASLVRSLESYYQSQRYPDVFVDVKQAPNQLYSDLAAIGGVGELQLRIRQRVSIDVPNLDEVAAAEVLSMPEQTAALSSLFFVQGAHPDSLADDQVVVYAPFAEANELQIGDSITMLLNGVRLRAAIVGTAISPEFLIIMSPGTLMLDNKRNAVVWMKHDVLASRYAMVGGWNSAIISLRPGADVDEVISQVDDAVKQYGSYGASSRKDQMSHRFITDEIRQNEVSALIIPTIIYAVAVFLLNVSINRLVLTQRSIIAILRAFGYSQWSIVVHYVLIALLIVLVGSGIGMCIGYVGGNRLATWYMEFYRFPRLLFIIPTSVWSTTFAIGLAAALLGTASAIRSVVRLQPAEAMHPPSPKSFRPGLVTRLTSTWRVNVMTRLMLQNIDRRMSQNLLVLTMIALATSIILVARYMNDAMDHMMLVEYERAKLADATLSFSRAVPEQSVRELESIEGIIRAEPYRLLAVDVLGRGEKFRTTLSSRSIASRLTRVVDQYGRLQKLPTGGFVMTDYLRKRLGFQVGDTVRMVVLESQRDTVSIVLAGSVSEALGSQCYASIETISSAQAEEPLANGAFVAIKKDRESHVQRKLKERPAVVGVLLRSTAIKSFTDVYGTNVLVVASYLFVLACLVAIGVLYNNARITIAERSVELASLRIQGFRIGEITRIVTGEHAILLVIALPLGLALGALMCYFITRSVEADFLRLPFVISRKTLLISSSVVVVVSAAVAFRVYLMLRKLDLVAVLKERV